MKSPIIARLKMASMLVPVKAAKGLVLKNTHLFASKAFKYAPVWEASFYRKYMHLYRANMHGSLYKLYIHKGGNHYLWHLHLAISNA